MEVIAVCFSINGICRSYWVFGTTKLQAIFGVGQLTHTHTQKKYDQCSDPKMKPAGHAKYHCHLAPCDVGYISYHFLPLNIETI